MEFLLIEQGTNKKVGNIELDYIPKAKDFIEFNDKVYGIHHLVHTKSCIKLKLIETEIEENEIIVDWN